MGVKMKKNKFVRYLAACIFLVLGFYSAGIICAQNSEIYTPKIIFEGKWGTGPGEFGFRMWEGEPDYPKSFVIDSKENIYILDYLNNRIQKFDSDGKYIASIPVESYKRATKEEIKESKKTWNKQEFDFATVSAREIYIDSEDNIYILQYKGMSDKSSAKEVLRLGKGKKVIQKDKIEKFNEVKNDYYATKKKIDNSYQINVDKNGNFEINNLKTAKSINITNKTITNTRSGNVKFFKTDKNKNIYSYVTKGINPYEVKKYDLSGAMIAKIDLNKFVPSKEHMSIPAIVSDVFVSQNGNIYYLEIIPDPNYPEFFSSSKGLKIVRMESR